MKSKERTWILLRGLAREKGHWGPFADNFERAFPGDEVLAIDLPGTGEFREETSPRTIRGIFNFVRARAIERSKAQASFHLVAISLGGMVALEWMRERPDDLKGAVLINTSVRSVSPFYRRLRYQLGAPFLKLAAEPNGKEKEKALAKILINSAEARERALPLWTRLQNENPVKLANVINQLWAAATYDWREATPDLPVLLLCGLGDRLVDPSCSIDLAQRTKWLLEKHSWGGHDLTWDDPEWVISQIRAWSTALT